MRRLRPAQVVKAIVTAVAPHGVHLDYRGVHIVVHVTDVPWGQELGPDEVARVGDTMDVTILRLVGDGEGAVGWLPWPPVAAPTVRGRATASRARKR